MRLPRSLEQPLDWRRLVGLAERHGLLPLVNHHVASDVGSPLPADVRTELDARAKAILARTLMMTSELVRIVRRHAAMDWTDVCDAARRAGAERMLAVSLGLVRDLMDVELPPPARRHVDRDPPARALADEVGRRLRSGELGTLDRPQEVRFHHGTSSDCRAAPIACTA